MDEAVGEVPVATSVATLRELSGLEQLRRMIDGRLVPAPMMSVLNFRLAAVEEGRATFVGTPKRDFYNPLGSVHGGWPATMLDSALGCAVHTTLAPGEAYTTLEFKVNIVRAILEDTGEMISKGRIVYRGRRTATAEAALRDAGGKLYAHGTTTCMIFPRV